MVSSEPQYERIRTSKKSSRRKKLRPASFFGLGRWFIDTDMGFKPPQHYPPSVTKDLLLAMFWKWPNFILLLFYANLIWMIKAFKFAHFSIKFWSADCNNIGQFSQIVWHLPWYMLCAFFLKMISSSLIYSFSPWRTFHDLLSDRYSYFLSTAPLSSRENEMEKRKSW